MLKIIFIFGTRPEAIKVAPVIKELAKYPKKFKVINCITAQHRQMLDQVLSLFEINVDYDLNIMKEDQDLFYLNSRLMPSLKKVLEREKPDLCLVQGDTTSAFLGGLASYYQKIKVGHIEAGLRTHQKYSPFPEETNRHLLSVIADLHFAPTKKAKENLLRENIPSSKIFVTGNTVIDALLMIANKNYEFDNPILEKIDFTKKIILITAHRRESFGKPFREMCYAFREIVNSYKDVELIYPVHLNPNVQKPVRNILKNVEGIHLIEPLDYKNFVLLMKKSYLILTDSGGIQEEAPTFHKPVLVMREVTERPEAVEAGTAKVVGTQRKRIVEETSKLLLSKKIYREMSSAKNPYGDGKSAKGIVRIISKELLHVSPPCPQGGTRQTSG
ncbi:MAG TPA: UDP-N-acetylglucosamine 2-epimerase (non-hydrolyzing) [candidate division Zixibacteria bacterium]